MYCSNLQRNEPPLKSICTFSTISCPTITKPTRRSAMINAWLMHDDKRYSWRFCTVIVHVFNLKWKALYYWMRTHVFQLINMLANELKLVISWCDSVIGSMNAIRFLKKMEKWREKILIHKGYKYFIIECTANYCWNICFVRKTNELSKQRL